MKEMQEFVLQIEPGCVYAEEQFPNDSGLDHANKQRVDIASGDDALQEIHSGRLYGDIEGLHRWYEGLLGLRLQ